MLVNCPKCGLSQPDDQYCAQCGVDMRTFKQKEKPLFNKIFGNAGVQIGILLIVAFIVGQSIFSGQQSKNWFKNITHFQGVSKSTRSDSSKSSNEEIQSLSTNHFEANESPSEIAPTGTSQQDKNAAGTKSTNLKKSSTDTSSTAVTGNYAAQNLSLMNFKVTYAEITKDVLKKWANDSNNLGLYQDLNDYAAGILYDYRKRTDLPQQDLKSFDMTLNLGTGNSNLSGNVSQDGNEMTGLATSIEYKSNENDIIHGEINITLSSSNGPANYPAEFALPKGAAFFIIGAIARNSFNGDRTKLAMPPFQIFKSADFMTRKTEFVIIIEPDYK